MMENFYLCLANDAYQYCIDHYFQPIYGKMYHKQALDVVCTVLSKKEGEYNFKELIEWMKINLDFYDIRIRIPIKRLFYMVDSHIKNGKFTTVSFTFYDNNNTYAKKKINKEELKLIDD